MNKVVLTEDELQNIISESIKEQFNNLSPVEKKQLNENVQEEGWVGALVGGAMGAIFGRACADALYGILKKSAVQAALGAAIGHAVQEEIKANPAILNPFKKRETMATGLNPGNVAGLIGQAASK